MLKKVVTHSIAFVLGIIVCTVVGVYASETLSSSSVYYDNTNSGGSSTNVSGAIDELYNLTQNPPNIVAYTYNEDSTAANYCVTGNEDTCVETKCYENMAVGSCPEGTIVDYMVNATDRVRFHIMYDNGSTLTMFSQKMIIRGSSWAKITNNTSGPNQVYAVLSTQTNNWNRVNYQTFTFGTTTFKNNAYVTCSEYNSCTSNGYTYAAGEQKTRSRLISVQEASGFGCTRNAESCPKWLYSNITDNKSFGTWTMNSYSASQNNSWLIRDDGSLQTAYDPNPYGARAVVEINK